MIAILSDYLIENKNYNFVFPICAGEPGSTVFGSILDGVFEGKIISPSESYYVEKASRYFPKNNNASFHTVVYKESDVEDPYRHIRTGTKLMFRYKLLLLLFVKLIICFT